MKQLEQVLQEQMQARMPEGIDASESQERVFLSFVIGRSRYCMAIEHVREVSPLLSLKPYPMPSRGHMGVVNLRGNIVPILCMEEIEGQVRNCQGCRSPDREQEDVRLLVVSFVEGEVFALVASQIRKVHLPQTESRVINIDGSPATFLGKTEFKSMLGVESGTQDRSAA